MTACQTDENLYFDPACNLTLDDQVRMVDDLLPQGPAWPRDPDSGLMRYWKAFAEVIKYAEDRICALSEEFYCDTAAETLDVWYDEYGIAPVDIAAVDAACLKPGFDPYAGLRTTLCAKLSAQGGGNCDYLVAVALAKGWVITCKDLSITYVPPVAGCAIVGCTHLAEHIEPHNTGACLGVSGLDTGTCAGVGGSELGRSALGPDCCDLAGYKGHATIGAAAGVGGACSPQTAGRADIPAPGNLVFPSCDTNDGTFPQLIGDSFTVQLTVNVNASMLLLQVNSPFTNLWTQCGCMVAGDVCNPLRGDLLQDLKDTINLIKPAHTVISYILA